MTTSPYEQVPEALRLADEWLRETQREVDRRKSVYDHYGMSNTPETLDPLGAKMAAELRRQHAENEALRAGYNAARHFFDAGWKACANFCDRDDVRFDGIVGHSGCPQFEEAFRDARKQGGA